MKLRWLGHSAVWIAGSRTILIDPFLTGNPKAAVRPEEITALDFVVLTHAHGDHLGDAYEIAKRTGATVVSLFEVTSEAEKQGIPVEPMNVGGSIVAKGVRFSMVAAIHTGPVCGMIIEMDGKTVYHMGDTGLLSDMGLLPEFFAIDVACVPIGDRFTMGADSAAKAVALCGAKTAVPIHYGTFPILDASADRFVEKVGGRAKVRVLRPGEELTVG
jgi:L-ascorbate metabolism protein UlaG (beta-lactamase superfamily)